MHSQSCPTLRPMGCSPPGSSVHGISQARILEWVAMSSSKGSSWPRDRNCILCVFCIGRRILLPLSYLGSQLLKKFKTDWNQPGLELWVKFSWMKLEMEFKLNKFLTRKRGIWAFQATGKKSNKKQGGQKWIQGKTKVEEEGKKKKKKMAAVFRKESALPSKYDLLNTLGGRKVLWLFCREILERLEN